MRRDDAIRIIKVENDCKFCDEIHRVKVTVMLGRRRISVTVDEDDLSQETIKRAIRRTLIAEAKFRLIKKIEGKRYSLGEILGTENRPADDFSD